MDYKLDFSILKTLTGLAGVSGREHDVRAYLKTLLAPYADEMHTDALGNLIVRKKGTSGKKMMLCAHMDEVGLMIHYVDDRGFARFTLVGGIDPRTLVAQRVRVQTRNGELLGVIGVKPAHITTEADRGRALGVKELFIDLGLPAEEANNRVGVFVLAELVRALKQPFYDVYAVFTVQEEVGLRGAQTAAYGIDADVALCLDTTGAADIPSVAPQDSITVLGAGAGITAIDARTITPLWLFEALKQICDQYNILRQVRVAPRGGNDAGAVHLSKTGVPTCGLSIPTRNIHSNVEVISKRDTENVFRLACLAAQQGLGECAHD